MSVQVENIFLRKREETKYNGLLSTEYATEKGDLELNLIELIKSQSAPSETNIPVASEGGDSDPDEQAEANTHSTLHNNYDH